jgi:hypothetical protein
VGHDGLVILVLALFVWRVGGRRRVREKEKKEKLIRSPPRRREEEEEEEEGRDIKSFPSCTLHCIERVLRHDTQKTAFILFSLIQDCQQAGWPADQTAAGAEFVAHFGVFVFFLVLFIRSVRALHWDWGFVSSS